MFLHTTSVQHLGGYRLYIAFNNGEAGEADLSERLHGPMFEPLRDLAQFATAHQDPIGGTVAWANGADLAPEYLIELVRQQRRKAA